MIFYAIYDHPSDYPHEFVCRRWRAARGAVRPIDNGEPFARGQTLDSVRAMLPANLTNLGRKHGDDPRLVETWI